MRNSDQIDQNCLNFGKPNKSQAFCMFIEGRTFSMSETAIQQIEYFDDCQGTDSHTIDEF